MYKQKLSMTTEMSTKTTNTIPYIATKEISNDNKWARATHLKILNRLHNNNPERKQEWANKRNLLDDLQHHASTTDDDDLLENSWQSIVTPK